MVPLKEVSVSGVRPSLWLLFAADSVLLLTTCTNIAALLLSRATHRRQEIAVRLSLGATRSAVAAQMLIETGVLALAGGALVAKRLKCRERYTIGAPARRARCGRPKSVPDLNGDCATA